MDKKEFKNQSTKEKVQSVLATIVLIVIILFIISTCEGGNTSYKSTTRGLFIFH